MALMSDVIQINCGDGMCIGAMSLTTPSKPMKLFKSLAAVAVVVTSTAFATPAKAQNMFQMNSCQSNSRSQQELHYCLQNARMTNEAYKNSNLLSNPVIRQAGQPILNDFCGTPEMRQIMKLGGADIC